MKLLKYLFNPSLYIAIGYIIIFNIYTPSLKSAKIFSIIIGIIIYCVGTYVLYRMERHTILSTNVYQHYKNCGLSDQDIHFFRERLTYFEKDIIRIKNKEEELSQLISKTQKKQLFQVLNGIYEELVIMPKKLIMVSDLLYKYLPNCIEGIEEKNSIKIIKQIKSMIELYKKMNEDDFEVIELEYLSE